MKNKILLAFTLAVLMSPAIAGIGVSVNIGDPGFFGRIDLGDSPRPEVYRDAPVVVDRAHYVEDPYYLRVPVQQQHHWRRYCGRYSACGRPVYFVKDDWYRNTYAPQYRERHGGGRYGDHDDGHRGDDRHDQGDHGDHGDHRDHDDRGDRDDHDDHGDHDHH